MLNVNQLLYPYRIDHMPNHKDTIHLEDCPHFFHIVPYLGSRTVEADALIEQLHPFQYSDIVRGQSCEKQFIFGIGQSTLELSFELTDADILVEGWLRYDEMVNQDILSLIQLEYLLYCLLKSVGLQ